MYDEDFVSNIKDALERSTQENFDLRRQIERLEQENQKLRRDISAASIRLDRLGGWT